MRVSEVPPTVVITVSVDWFFLSHRLPLARTLRERGHRVVVAAQETDGRSRIEREGLEFSPLPLDRGSRAIDRELRVVQALVGLYRRVRPALVHHVSPKPILYGSAAARLAGVSRVINAVSGLGFAFIERPGEGRRAELLRTGLRTAYRAAFRGEGTRVIFQNLDDAAALGVRVPDPRVRIVRGSGVDLRRFPVSPLPDGPPVVVLPARVLGDKGVREFVAAAAQLKREGSDARFVLAGRSDPQNPAGVPEDEIARWVADGLIEWPGHVDNADMPALYASATLVVLPSYREGMPLALAEAAACGRAAVATDVPGCREIIAPGETGWLAPPRDARALAEAIREALSDRSRLVAMGNRARRRVEAEFSLDAVVAQTLAIYNELLA